MKSLFEEMGGTYHWEGDYLIPDITLPPAPDYRLGKLNMDVCAAVT